MSTHDTAARFREACTNGEVQALINEGFTVDDLKEKYSVSQYMVSRQVNSKVIEFPDRQDGLKKRDSKQFHTWSDAKKLAMGKW